MCCCINRLNHKRNQNITKSSMGCCFQSKSRGGSSRVIKTDSVKKEEHDDIIITEISKRPGVYFATCNDFVFIGRTVEGTSGEAFIANRVTKSLRKLPPPTLRTGDDHVIFDDHVFGLTFRASTNQYSVIHYFLCKSNNRLLGCEVITGGTGDDKNSLTVSSNWKLLKAERNEFELCRQSRKIIFVKDVAHWMVYEIGVRYLVVSFNMVKQRFWETKLPQCCRPGTIELLDIGGDLSAVTPTNKECTKFDIWILKYLSNKEWVKKQRISLGRVERSVSAIQSEEGGRIIIFREKRLSDSESGKQMVYYAYDVYLNQTTHLGIEPGSEKRFPHAEKGPVVFKTLGIFEGSNEETKRIAGKVPWAGPIIQNKYH